MVSAKQLPSRSSWIIWWDQTVFSRVRFWVRVFQVVFLCDQRRSRGSNIQITSTILIENSLDYKGLLFLMAPVDILLFLEFFYLESKSDDFINSSSVIARSIRESNVGGRLFSPILSIRNRLGLYDSMARLLRFFVGHLSGKSVFTGATLRAGFRLRYYNYCCRAVNR